MPVSPLMMLRCHCRHLLDFSCRRLIIRRLLISLD